MRAKRVRWLGWGVIALLWATTCYLVVYYGLLLWLGPDRLYALLGQDTYNALVPVGGFGLLLLVLLGTAVWLLPLAGFYTLASACLHAASSGVGRRRRQAIAGLVSVGLTLSLPAVLLDGWPWALMPLVWEDDTEFAAGYSPLGFLRVRTGMTPAEVTGLLGSPLEQYTASDAKETWRWTRSPHSSSYRMRAVVFRNGRVAEKYSEFYVD